MTIGALLRRRSVSSTAAPRKKFNKGAFYRTCRMLHTYLSAAAFIILMFFAVSGLLLNHPDWFGAKRVSDEPVLLRISSPDLEAAVAGQDPEGALVSLVKDVTDIRGGFRDADITSSEAFLRFSGVKGATDVFIDMETGQMEVEVGRSNLPAIIHDLHRGKDAGIIWKRMIDVAAILILCMSLVGLILFFSLRFRLATSLKIIGGTLVAFVSIYLAFVT